MSDEFKPLPYNNWLAKNGLSSTEDFAGYSKYLVNWYNSQQNPKTNLKSQYIQLLQDLNFVFGDEKRNQFLTNINFYNQEEVINSLPYFVDKIKEIAKNFSDKRQSIKKSKLKYNLTSSNAGIEALLYEYILRCFTKKDGIAPIPYKEFSRFLPELENSNKLLFIEVEELYDNSNYFDTAPKNLKKNIDEKLLVNEFPYKGKLNQAQILGILSATLKERAASTPLSKIFFNFLDENNPNLNDTELLYYDVINAQNTIAANEKYMGNDLFGLTAIKMVTQTNTDFTANIPINVGNNWFYWPSGSKIFSSTPIDNIYFPIEINNTNLVLNGATGSGDYRTSDIILTDKKGFIEGAWLMGPRFEYSRNKVSFTVEAGEKRQFLWPYTGFNLAKISNVWRGFALNDDSNKYFYFLSDKEKNIILNNYYTLPLPALSSEPVYLNSTNLCASSALAAFTALDADVILKQKHTFTKDATYSGPTEAAFLYRFHDTEITIQEGVNNILWPLMRIESENQNIPITIKNDFCDPVELQSIDVQKCFRGAVAGVISDEADIIYKIDKRSGQPVEAAWLSNTDISSLDTNANDVQVYKTKASSVCCETYIEGSNQDGLFSVVPSGKRISFIWGDRDTYADEVFNYVSHTEGCPYEKIKTNYYRDQDGLNPTPITQKKDPWTQCTCKAVLYSPIGHKGSDAEEYNGMADLLYADPKGYGDDFDFSTWQDTRCLNYKSSPQFSFFKLDSNAPDDVGFWNGQWKTPTDDRMVLKTGRRYTYYRTHFKKIENNGPVMVFDYVYKNPSGFCLNPKPLDIVLCVDLSNSQKFNLDITKQIVEKMFYDKPDNVHIGIVAFNSKQYRCSYLSKYPDLSTFLNKIISFKESDPYIYRTNIVDALRLAEYLLTTTITENNKTSVLNWSKLCRDVNATIVDAQRVPISNQPRLNEVDKKIILISDGIETSEVALGYGQTQEDSDKFSEGKLALLPYVKALKRKTFPLTNSAENETVKFIIQTIDIGPLSSNNKTMETLASSSQEYFNLQKYLINNDTDDVSRIIKNIVYRTTNCYDVFSRWKKLVRNNTEGSWVDADMPTDMILRPGDLLVYLHRGFSLFSSPANSYVNFQMPSKSFNIKIPLKGWDYANNKYVKDDLVVYRGAKPFWGKAYVEIDIKNNFQKEFIYMGGHTRWIDDYLPVKQPEVSMMVLENGDFIEYNRRASSRFKFTEELNFVEYKKNYQWNKLEFSKQYSNLNKFFKNDKLEYVATPTNIRSDLLIEGYYEFKPARYNYLSRSNFTFTQNLELIYKCRSTYSQLLTSKVLETKQPYAHLDNVNFPTTPLIPYVNNFVTEKQVGGYLLPNNLGVPYFSPFGYSFELDELKISEFQKSNREMIFLDPEKYGPITKGLTDQDNLSPVKVKSIDNRWMMIPYGSGEISGTITNTKNFQKFTAYQSEYEVYGTNNYGVSRPTDNFQFYNNRQEWIGGGRTFRGEVTEKMYLERNNKFLANTGVLTKWRMDLFGNNYALYKSKEDGYNLQTDESNVNYNNIDAPRENLSTDDYPKTQNFPENYENLAYNVKAIDYLDFIVEDE